MFRTDRGAFPSTAVDYVFLPGGHRHQIANLSVTEPLLYQVVLVPPVTPRSIVVDAPFEPARLDRVAPGDGDRE